jgi:hypothetical protein
MGDKVKNKSMIFTIFISVSTFLPAMGGDYMTGIVIHNDSECMIYTDFSFNDIVTRKETNEVKPNDNCYLYMRGKVFPEDNADIHKRALEYYNRDIYVFICNGKSYSITVDILISKLLTNASYSRDKLKYFINFLDLIDVDDTS